MRTSSHNATFYLIIVWVFLKTVNLSHKCHLSWHNYLTNVYLVIMSLFLAHVTLYSISQCDYLIIVIICQLWIYISQSELFFKIVTISRNYDFISHNETFYLLIVTISLECDFISQCYLIIVTLFLTTIIYHNMLLKISLLPFTLTQEQASKNFCSFL